jgi:5-methyltetrahydrofolate--homocysteine methyltransferase
MDLMQQVSQGVRQGNAASVSASVEALVKGGAEPQEIFDQGLFAGMTVIGRLFKDEEIFMPEVLMSAKAMQAGVDILEPLLLGSGSKKLKGKIVLGTVKGDLHDLGKNLVGLMLRGAGYDVVDLGINVACEGFVEAVKAENAQVLGMSALLTTTMPQMATVIEGLNNSGLGHVKTIIGGCVINQSFADLIGADAYAENAGVAVDKIDSFFAIKAASREQG